MTKTNLGKILSLIMIWIFLGCGVTGTVELPPDTEPPPDSADIAALFFGIGPSSENSIEGNGCLRGTGFTKWADGTNITIRISSATMTQADIDAVTLAAANIEDLTSGRIRASVVSTGEEAPLPEEGEITAFSVPNPVDMGCPDSAPQGCVGAIYAKYGSGGPEDYQITYGIFITIPDHPVQAVVHDIIGHLVLGLCHIDSSVAGPGESLMSFGGSFTSDQLPFDLTARDIAAIRPIYASSLDVGATAQDFVGTGLIDASDISKLQN